MKNAHRIMFSFLQQVDVKTCLPSFLNNCLGHANYLALMDHAKIFFTKSHLSFLFFSKPMLQYAFGGSKKETSGKKKTLRRFILKKSSPLRS
jgi:hypothetical protein